MECNTKATEEGFVFEIGSLYEYLQTIPDARKPRGKRYELGMVLLFFTLGKLCGQDNPYGIAEWIGHRKKPLGEELGIAIKTTPHHSTYRRIFEDCIEAEEFEQKLKDYWEHQITRTDGKPIVIVLDGKTLRGTITRDDAFGLHLLAAYVPGEGVVLMQLPVEKDKENEISGAPQLLKSLDLRNTIVLADAMHTQRAFSVQIVVAGGEYVWAVKDNQSSTRAAIETLFAPEKPIKGIGCPPMDFRSASTTDSANGRIEVRKITVSSALNDYLDWPYLEQVFKLERRFTYPDGKVHEEISYGITSLTTQEADPKRLLDLVRTEWSIENGLHYRRDVSLREDHTRMINKNMAQVLAAFNNLILGILAQNGYENIPQARRFFDAHIDKALALLRGL